MVSQPRIFVTGGTGFIGSYIIRTLVKADYRQITATHRESSNFELVAEIKDEITWVTCDILDIMTLQEAIQGHDVVIHAAALISFDTKDQYNLTQTNTVGTANVVNACLSQGIKRLIHISSIGVFPRKNPGEIIDESVEWSDSNLHTDYAISKYQAELEVWRGGAEGLAVMILNPSLVIGSGHWSQGTAAIFSQVQKGLRFFPRGATGLVDVRDVADAVLKVLQKNISGERLIISGENYTYRKMLKTIAGYLGTRPPHIELNRVLIEVALFRNWILSSAGVAARVITRASLKNAQHHWSFDHSRSSHLLSFKYRSVDQCIFETCQQLKEVGGDPQVSKYLDV